MYLYRINITKENPVVHVIQRTKLMFTCNNTKYWCNNGFVFKRFLKDSDILKYLFSLNKFERSLHVFQDIFI